MIILDSTVAIITDIHFDCRGGSQFFLDRYQDFFDNQFFPDLLAKGIKTVICLGDTWENRKSIGVNSLHYAKRMFFDKLQSNGIKLICILGNHDVVYKNTNDVNSMEIVESAYDNVTLVTDTATVQVGNYTIDLVSWINNENYQSRLEFITKSASNICAGHFEINGFEMTAGHYCETGLGLDLFEKYQATWSGHFHIRSQIGNVQYLGNPFQTNRGDTGSRRGYHIFDGNTGNLTFVKNNYEIYSSIKFNDLIDLTTYDFQQYKNKIVIVDVVSLLDCNTRLLNLFCEKLSSVAYKVEINETVGSVKVTDITDHESFKTHTELMAEYVDSTIVSDNESIKPLLKNILNTLYNEATANTRV